MNARQMAIVYER